MNLLLNEIEEFKSDTEKLRLMEPSILEEKPGSTIRVLYAQARRIAGFPKALPSPLVEEAKERYCELLEEARRSVE